MWHRLQLLVRRKDQYPWLQAESQTRGKSIGEIIRDLIDAAMSHRNKSGESETSTQSQKTGTR